jgi:hypothetical protein
MATKVPTPGGVHSGSRRAAAHDAHWQAGAARIVPTGRPCQWSLEGGRRGHWQMHRPAAVRRLPVARHGPHWSGHILAPE